MDLRKGQEIEAKAEAKKLPSGLVIICGLISLTTLLTYIIPGGECAKITVDGREMVDPNSFSYVASHPASLLEISTSVPKRFQATSWIYFLILIMDGTFSVINDTGAIQAALNSLLKKNKGKDIFLTPVIILLFSIVPTLMGTLEAYLVFVPLGVMLVRSVGLNTLVGIAIIMCTGGTSLVNGITDPFNIGVAQGLVGLPVFSGVWLRILTLIGFSTSVSFWATKYAIMLKEDKKNNWIYDVEQRAEGSDMIVEVPEFDTKRKLVPLSVLAGMGYITYLTLTGGDLKNGIPAVFLMMLVVVEIVMRYSPNEVFRRSGKGAQGVVGDVLIMGFAKVIVLILGNPGTADTIIHTAVQALNSASGVLTAEIMYLIGRIGSFFITSNAGLTTILVPILFPIGDMAGVTQQTICAVAVLGGALGNMIMPTSPLTSGTITMTEIDYRVYLKFVICIFLTNSVRAAILVAIAAIVQIGPF